MAYYFQPLESPSPHDSVFEDLMSHFDIPTFQNQSDALGDDSSELAAWQSELDAWEASLDAWEADLAARAAEARRQELLRIAQELDEWEARLDAWEADLIAQQEAIDREEYDFCSETDSTEISDERLQDGATEGGQATFARPTERVWWISDSEAARRAPTFEAPTERVWWQARSNLESTSHANQVSGTSTSSISAGPARTSRFSECACAFDNSNDEGPHCQCLTRCGDAGVAERSATPSLSSSVSSGRGSRMSSFLRSVLRSRSNSTTTFR